MDAWYVRDKGRTLGPFSMAQLRQMRAGRQLPGYVEVSRDQVAWQPIDLVTQTATATAPNPAGPSLPYYPPPAGPDARRGSLRRTIILGSLGGVGFVALLTAAVVAYKFSGRTATAAGQVGTTPPGVIRLAPGTPDDERDRLFRESIGLVIPGRKFTSATGVELESRYFESVPDKNGKLAWVGGSGSGFVVSADGYFLTNQHVVERAYNYERSTLRKMFDKTVERHEITFWVFFGKDRKCEAKVVHVSKKHDMAILKLDRAMPYYFSLCDTPPDAIPTLDRLHTLGFPGKDREAVTRKEAREAEDRKGLFYKLVEMEFADADFSYSDRRGDITRAAQKRKMSEDLEESYILLHTASVYSGNSGGPLVTQTGTAIGINTWSTDDGGFNFAQCLPDMRKEIDEHVPGAVWRGYKD